MALWLVAIVLLGSAALGAIRLSPMEVAAVALGLCLTIALGVMSQRCGFFATPLNRVEGAGARLALTFDDGPDPEVTPLVLELLARHSQRATFFVVGERAAQQPELCGRIVAEGHELGNHSLSHAWHMAFWSSRAVAKDLRRAEELIAGASGQRPAFFRAPAAVLSPRISAGAELAGLTLVGFSVRTGDGSRHRGDAHVRRKLERGLRGGNILLLHDSRVEGRAPVSLGLLPEVLEQMRGRGLTSVTLSELVKGE